MNALFTPEVHLQAGELYFGGGHTRVHTLLGTCVAIVIWHPQLRLGGMCHYLLPVRGPGQSAAPAGMYATEVMGLFAAKLAASNTTAAQYVVKLFGGGRMFNASRAAAARCTQFDCAFGVREGCHDVACMNVSAGREMLTARGFKISVEDVGGSGSRHLIFDVWSGDVWVKHGKPLEG